MSIAHENDPEVTTNSPDDPAIAELVTRVLTDGEGMVLSRQQLVKLSKGEIPWTALVQDTGDKAQEGG